MLAKIFDITTFTDHKVIYFVAYKYSFNFFKLFFNFLNKQHCIKVSNLFINNIHDWQMCEQTLGISFLGQSAYYWLHEIGMDGKQKQHIYKYLTSYSGPHTVLLFVNSEDVLPEMSASTINLDLKTSKDLILVIKLLSGANHLRIIKFIKSIQDILGFQLDLDQLCILVQYGSLVRDLDEFDIKWVYYLVGIEQSLFELSKHFLSRDSLTFYKAWSQVSSAYSDQFWLTFFSEQIFRAYWFILYQNLQDFKLAKQIGFRLPFDFMKTGWRYVDLDLLKQAHHYLYKVDYQLKNGGSDLWIEAFFNNFFKNSFIV